MEGETLQINCSHCECVCVRIQGLLNPIKVDNDFTLEKFA